MYDVHDIFSFRIQDWTEPEDSRRLRLPELLDSQHMKVVRSALSAGRLYLISVRG